jgi:hypothetical protein
MGASAMEALNIELYCTEIKSNLLQSTDFHLRFPAILFNNAKKKDLSYFKTPNFRF